MRNRTTFFRSTAMFFGVALILAIITGCKKPKPTGYSLKERILISQMVQDSVLVYFPIIDSICDANFQEDVEKMADSLFPFRLEQILKQRRREISKSAPE